MSNKLTVTKIVEGISKYSDRKFKVLEFKHLPEVEMVRRLKLNKDGSLWRDQNGKRQIETAEVLVFYGNGLPAIRIFWDDSELFNASVGSIVNMGSMVTRQVEPYVLNNGDHPIVMNTLTTVVFSDERVETVIEEGIRSIKNGDFKVYSPNSHSSDNHVEDYGE